MQSICLWNLTRISLSVTDGYIAYSRFGCEIPILAVSGEIFLDVWPLDIVRYCDIIGRKHALWRIYRADRSRNATWARAEESKKRKKTPTCDKSHICPDHPRCATAPKLSRAMGSRTSQPYQVSSKSVQGFSLPEGSKSAIFLRLVLFLI